MEQLYTYYNLLYDVQIETGEANSNSAGKAAENAQGDAGDEEAQQEDLPGEAKAEEPAAEEAGVQYREELLIYNKLQEYQNAKGVNLYKYVDESYCDLEFRHVHQDFSKVQNCYENSFQSKSKVDSKFCLNLWTNSMHLDHS